MDCDEMVDGCGVDARRVSSRQPGLDCMQASWLASAAAANEPPLKIFPVLYSVWEKNTQATQATQE
jgi:hypothetical protein